MRIRIDNVLLKQLSSNQIRSDHVVNEGSTFYFLEGLVWGIDVVM